MPVWILLSLAHDRLHHRARVMETLDRALRMGESGGFLRSFVNEGEPVRSLINAYPAWEGAVHSLEMALDFKRLLAAFTAIVPSGSTHPLPQVS
jgi:LuxR family maltose regulon positive regulatory protein